jgi:hypothetical protein
MPPQSTTRRGFVVSLCVVAWAGDCLARTTLSPALEGAILAKALNYDQTIRARHGHPRVLVVTSDPNSEETRILAKAFQALKSQVNVVLPARAPGLMPEADAVYAFQGLLTAQLQALCVRHEILSMTRDMSLVLAAQATLSVGVEAERPQIVVNLKRAKAEGHKLSSRLLKLAKVVE